MPCETLIYSQFSIGRAPLHICCKQRTDFSWLALCHALVYIFDPFPPTSSSHVEGLNCDLLLREFCAAFAYLNAWQACCPPGVAFLAVERVTEPVLRVRVIRSHSTTMPCDVSSSFPRSPNQAEVPVCGVLHHTCMPRAKTLCLHAVTTGPVKKAPGWLLLLFSLGHSRVVLAKCGKDGAFCSPPLPHDSCIFCHCRAVVSMGQ